MANEPPTDSVPHPEPDSPEARERAAAFRRGAAREHERSGGAPAPGHAPEPARDAVAGRARGAVAARAFAALADNVRDYAIFLLDPAGVITFWGEGARYIKWWTKDQAEGAHLRLLYPSGGAEDGSAEAHLQTAAERGEYTGEGHRVRSDGSTFWAGVTLTALWDEDGTLLGFAKVTRDLTARRAADNLLQAAAEASETARNEAVAASNAKSGFLATMSHEIRTPVNAILGYHELLDLEIDGPLTPGQRRSLARAGASARHLLALISEVLDFSRIEAEQVSVERTAFRIGDAVGGALSLVTPQARERGLELNNEVGGYAAGLSAWGDEARVRQILVNLLSNAIAFTTARSDEPGRIAVSAGTATQASPDAELDGDGPWVYVRVEDNGAGIPADRLRPIFEAFVQADMTLTRRHGGTGLGLAICRRLARLMGGDVTVRSEVGVGSTFILWIPAAPVESLGTGGLAGHGPGGELGAAGDASPPAAPRSEAATRPLRATADAVLAELERVLHAYVARLRSDPATPSAHARPESEIEDHLASFLADMAGMLYQLDLTLTDPQSEAAAEVQDGTAIQRVVAERHGAQRARLGWAEDEIRREFVILNEELAAAVRRGVVDRLAGPTREAREREAERCLVLLARFTAVSERLSVAAYRAASAGGMAERSAGSTV